MGNEKSNFNFSQYYKRRAEEKAKILRLCPEAKERPGIYIFRREEDGIKYAYVGQAQNLLNRLVDHLMRYDQWIELSIKKHKLYSLENPTGWKINCIYCEENQLDQMEHYYIKQFAQTYQMRNKTTGGQDDRKRGMDINRQGRKYWDGVKTGKRQLAKELLHIIDLHLDIKPVKDTSSHQKAYEKFLTLLHEAAEDTPEE